MRAVVLADTHCRSADLDRLPRPVVAAAERADVVLHAGDVVAPGMLDALAGLAPVHAVLGNNDHQLAGTLPETLRLDLGGVPVALVHDAGRRDGRPARLHRRFPWAAIVVYGHSHVPVDEVGLDGQILFNPGSPTQRRAQPRCSYGELELADGRVRRRRIVPV